MSGKNVVGLYSFNGMVGGGFLKELAKAHNEGKITLIALHRDGSKTSNVPEGIEKRVLNYNETDQSKVAEALKGIDILVSAVDKVPQEQHLQFLKHLSQVKSLTTFFPSDFSVNWTPEELKVSENSIAQDKAAVNKQAHADGVPITEIHNGLFAPLFLNEQVSGVDVPGNKLALYGDAWDRKIAVTTIPYFSKAIAQLVSGPKDELPGKRYTINEVEWSGKEIAEALEKVNGSKPEVKKITDDDLKSALQQGVYAALSAELQRKWGAGSYPDIDPFKPKGVEPVKLDELLASAKK